ncbi:MarR family transcriptional regulator [Streptococcus gallolyticus]|uniref:MarR family winged helix-turn-helix transcriptional regulator n=1 Tax=Streptococcus hepaticus TaxID=3349163 RepID=UPI001C958FD6|nr:MarR family transcriptional regulator [Streptococcus gallolyticus]MBY5042062.1 MarR family transcriptional regulator [Streptococcus gallolyticus]
MEKSKGGYLNMQVHLLNGRLFQSLLNKEPDVLYRSEQGKILSALWSNEGCLTATDIALKTGLANNTLTNMLKRLEEQKLLIFQEHPNDKRKKFVTLTELGWSQEKIGDKVSQELADIFYTGFSEREIADFEAYMERILKNLQAASRK